MAATIQEEMIELETSIEEAKKIIERKNALHRLMGNSDFKKIIDDDYLREEAIRLSHLLGSPDTHLKTVQEDILNDLKGIAALRRYFHTVIIMGRDAEQMIISHEETLEDLRQEEIADINGANDEYEGD
jgi:hypothetical protein